MVSLDDAVLARLEKGGSRYEILVDPDLVDSWKKDHSSVSIDDLLATDQIWNDARAGDRPTNEALMSVFGTTEIIACVDKILSEGTIQLTTVQRKKIIADKRIKIIHQIATTATDPRTKLPHPKTRIELALDEIRFSIDPFLSIDRQVQDAIKLLKPVIPLSFITIRLAFKVPGSDYGGVHRIFRESINF